MDDQLPNRKEATDMAKQDQTIISGSLDSYPVVVGSGFHAEDGFVLIKYPDGRSCKMRALNIIREAGTQPAPTFGCNGFESK